MNEAVNKLPKELERYLRQISRRLNLPRSVRKRVMSDLRTSVCAQVEDGAGYRDICAQYGAPKTAASGINEEMSVYAYRKSPLRFVCLAVALAAFLGLLLDGVAYVSYFFYKSASIGVIGGADGPTSIFVTVSPAQAMTRGLLFLLALTAAGIFGFYRLSRLKKKDND